MQAGFAALTTKLNELQAPRTGGTPKRAVYKEDKLVLYRYGGGSRPDKTPLLIVYSLVNRPDMLDLQSDRSLVRGLLNAGLDVYLIDWGYPDDNDRYSDLDYYINGLINRCVDVIRKSHNLDAINILGVCQGGTFSLCYSALHGEKINTLVTMVTPVDFHSKDFLLSHLLRHVDIDLLVNTYGNVPGVWLNFLFLSLKPYSLMSQKYVDLLDMIDDKEKLQNFLRMEKWIFDSPDQAGEAFREFAKSCFQQNLLVQGKLTIGGKNVDLKSIGCPTLNIYASEDHLVPPASSKALAKFLPAKNYQEIEFKGGHIGIYVSGRAQLEIPSAIGNWIGQTEN